MAVEKRYNDRLDSTDLNLYGLQGWELVSITVDRDYGFSYFFKKQYFHKMNRYVPKRNEEESGNESASS